MTPRRAPEVEREQMDSLAIENFYRFRTCPACRAERMMFQVNRDAVQCPDPTCGLVIDGKTNRQGAAAILDAIEAHEERLRLKRAGETKPVVNEDTDGEA